MNVIEIVANELKLPTWWVEAIAIEYCDCREFAMGEEIWSFNFSKIKKEDLEEALKTHHIVSCHGFLVHNAGRDVTGTRMLISLAKPGFAIVESNNDIIPDGPISDNCFLFRQNPIELWDPKLNFSEWVQMY